MPVSHLIPANRVLSATTIQAHVISLAERSVVDGACPGSGGVCIPTTKCTSGGGNYISNACPGTPNDITCCTKTACGTGGGLPLDLAVQHEHLDWIVSPSH